MRVRWVGIIQIKIRGATISQVRERAMRISQLRVRAVGIRVRRVMIIQVKVRWMGIIFFLFLILGPFCSRGVVQKVSFRYYTAVQHNTLKKHFVLISGERHNLSGYALILFCCGRLCRPMESTRKEK